eukprot:6247221-Amphidinium_carterae.1
MGIGHLCRRKHSIGHSNTLAAETANTHPGVTDNVVTDPAVRSASQNAEIDTHVVLGMQNQSQAQSNAQ